MIFGKSSNIPGFPRVILYRVNGMGWCHTFSDSVNPIMVGNECWWRLKADAIKAMESVRETHIPVEWMPEHCRMVPRANLQSA